MSEIIKWQGDQTLKRHSGIDLLRIIAIFLICMSHANQTFRDMFSFPTFSATNLISAGISPFGTIGNILFVICSSYFLVDKTRSRLDKAINILFDSALISINIMIGFLIGREPLSGSTILHQIFPDLFGMNWFIPCYIIFYLIAPIIVVGLKHLSKEQHFALLIGALVIYGMLSLIKMNPIGSDLLMFFYILNIVAFIKWHKPSIYLHRKANFFFFLIGIIVCYLAFFGAVALSKKIEFFERVTIMSMLSPLLVLPLIALFNIFESMSFNNRTISFLSSCSLFVYVIHDNYLLRRITRIKYYNWTAITFGENYMLLYMFLCGLFMFFVGFVLAIIYKESLGKITKILAIKLSKLLTDINGILSGKVFNKNN